MDRGRIIKKGEKKKWGRGKVVWETGTLNPRRLFRVDRESRNVDVALLFSGRGSKPHRGEGTGGGMAGLTHEAKI